MKSTNEKGGEIEEIEKIVEEIIREVKRLERPREDDFIFLGKRVYRENFVKIELGDVKFVHGSIISVTPTLHVPDYIDFGDIVRARIAASARYFKLLEIEKISGPQYTTFEKLAEIATTNQVVINISSGQEIKSNKAAGVIPVVLRFEDEGRYGISAVAYELAGGAAAPERRYRVQVRKGAINALATISSVIGDLLKLRDYDSVLYLQRLASTIVAGPAYVVATERDGRTFYDVKRIKPVKVYTLGEENEHGR